MFCLHRHFRNTTDDKTILPTKTTDKLHMYNHATVWVWMLLNNYYFINKIYDLQLSNIVVANLFVLIVNTDTRENVNTVSFQFNRISMQSHDVTLLWLYVTTLYMVFN